MEEIIPDSRLIAKKTLDSGFRRKDGGENDGGKMDSHQGFPFCKKDYAPFRPQMQGCNRDDSVGKMGGVQANRCIWSANRLILFADRMFIFAKDLRGERRRFLLSQEWYE